MFSIFENKLIRSGSLRPTAVLQLDPVKSTVYACVHFRTGLLPSTGTPSQNRGSCYQMVKQTHHPTAHNSNPLSTILSSCLSLVPIFGACEREGRGRKGGPKNGDIMRIGKKFLGGVFNFNHQDNPSWVALISSPPLSLSHPHVH